MTAFGYVNDLRMMADMASAVRAPNALAYTRRFHQRLGEYHTAFFNATSGSYGHGTQSELAMALWIGAPPTDALKASVAANLARKIELMIDLTANATSATAPAGTELAGGVGVRYLVSAALHTILHSTSDINVESPRAMNVVVASDANLASHWCAAAV